MGFLNFSYRKGVRVFVSGLPKAGTHLIIQCLIHLAGLKTAPTILSNVLGDLHENVATLPEAGIKIGVDNPVFIKKSLVESILRKVKKKRIVFGHVPYSEEMDDILSDLDYPGIAIIRDPRDMVVSHVYYIWKQEEHYLHHYYQSLDSFDKCLMKSILGFEDQKAGLKLLNIAERFKAVDNWRQSPLFYVTKFEDLIGERGGGHSGKQEEEIFSIAEHLGIVVSKKKTHLVSNKMFGRGHSFRKGKIGGWRESFKEEHTVAFKKVAGDLLIKSGYEKDMDW